MFALVSTKVPAVTTRLPGPEIGAPMATEPVALTARLPETPMLPAPEMEPPVPRVRVWPEAMVVPPSWAKEPVSVMLPPPRTVTEPAPAVPAACVKLSGRLNERMAPLMILTPRIAPPCPISRIPPATALMELVLAPVRRSVPAPSLMK